MTSQIIPLSFVLLNLETVEINEKKTQTFENLKNDKSFLDEIKSIFHSFESACFLSIYFEKKKVY